MLRSLRNDLRRGLCGGITVSLVLPLAIAIEIFPPAAVALAAEPSVEVTTSITAPADGDTVDEGVVIDAVASAGVTAGGERAVIVVLDLSGSVNDPAGGDCNGNGTNDTILTCEIEAAIEVFDRAVAVGNVNDVGVAVFAGSGTPADVSPATGFQYLTAPDADLDGDGVRDLDEVVRSVFVNGGVRLFTSRSAGAGTNYAAGVQASCTVANQASTENPLVVFMSDGGNLLGSDITTQLPCTNASEFQTFAVGAGASCTADPTGRGSLAELATLTGGACTNVVSPADLPRILSEALAPDLTSVTASINGGAPIDISAFVSPVLPAPSVTIAWPAIGLSPGINQICITSKTDIAGVPVASTDCIEVFARGGVDANAGPDQSVDEGSIVQLDATESTGSGLRTTTWTTTDEFAAGAAINLEIEGDRLALDEQQQAFNFIWIAASARGTVIKVDTQTGEILGEYWSAPQNRAKDPSRTTVDKSGSVWVGNRAETSTVNGVTRGSVAKIGLLENGQCVDRNGDGVIRTSSGLGDILAWPNAGGEDNAGGVSTATDECIIEYVRTGGVAIRHVSVDSDNHVWVGGPAGTGSPRIMDRITPTGEIVRSIDMRNPAHTGETSAIECCYGGLIDRDGIIWTATANRNRLVRIDPAYPNGSPDLVRVFDTGRTSYGLGLDPDGNIWQTNWTFGTVQKIQPDGAIVGLWSTGGPSNDRGVAATPDGDIWVANSGGASVSRLTNDGAFITQVTVGSQPTGIGVDADGKVWSTNLGSNTATRIDPATNTADLTVDLGAGAGPYNYSDMTGSTLSGAATEGTWSVVHDSGTAGTTWSLVDWTADVVGDGSVEVFIETSEDGITYGPRAAASDELRLFGVRGRYARLTVELTRASTGESPLVYDLSLAQPGVTDALSYDWRIVEAAGPPIFLSSTTSATPSFIAPDDGVYTFELTVTDGAGQTDSDRVTVAVTNVDPALDIDIGDSFAGGVTQITASFTDTGWLDSHSATIDWGDGTIQPIVVTAQGTGWGTFFGSHVYGEAGSFSASVTLTDDDGGTATAEIGQVSVADPVALWANSSTVVRAIDWSGTGGSIEGRVHTNSELRFVGSTKSVEGPASYVTRLTADTTRHIFNPPPVQTTNQTRPFDVDIAAFRPGGTVELTVGAAYHDMTSACASGVWHATQAVLAPGVYYAPCSVQLNGANIGGEVTLVAEGTIKVSGSRPAFEPYFEGLLFVSGSAAARAIDIAASSSKFLGIVFTDLGGIDLSGSTNEFYCGIFGNTINLTGGGLRVRGATCGEPDSTVAGPLLVPDLALDLEADRDVAGPSETIGYDLAITNAGGRLIVPGLFGVENVDDAPATLTAQSLAFERLDVASNSWVAFPVDTADVALDIRPNPYPGVTYGAAGPVGTTLEPGGLATWGYQAVISLDADELSDMLDPAVTRGLRAVIEFEQEPAAVQLRSLYRYGSDFSAPVRELGGDITDVDVTVLLPEGDPIALSDVTHPDLARLAPAQSIAATTSFDVPVPAPRSEFETDAGYLARLQRLNSTRLTAAAFAIARGGVGLLVAPIVIATTDENLPIVTTGFDGPASVQAGTVAAYDVPVRNVGGEAAATASVARADGTPLVVTDAPSQLTAGQIVHAATTYQPAADLSGPVSLRAETTWTDARGVIYGPLGTTAAVDVLAPGSIAATLIDTLVGDASGDGYVSPGDTIRYTATVTNRGGAALTGIVAEVQIDPRTTLISGSAATTAGTVTSGQTAGDAAVAVAIGTLAGGATVTITFEVVIADPFPAGVQRIDVSGAAWADGIDPVAFDDPSRPGGSDPTGTPIVVPRADVYASLAAELAIDRDGNGIASSGDQLRYTLKVDSTGSLPVTGVRAAVPVPAPATLVAGSVTTSVGTVNAGSDVDVAIGGLAAFGDETVVITYLVNIDPALTTDTTLSMQASITTPEVGERLSDDQSTTDGNDATVTPIAKLFSGGGSGGGGSGGGGSGGGGSTIPGPSVSGSSITEGELLAEPTTISMTLTPPELETITGWTITYRRTGTDQTGTLAASGPITSGDPITISGEFDPTLLPNGSYEIVVRSTSSDGGVTESIQTVVVDGEFKPGRFTLAYEDLTVQFPGLPVRVVRAYDSFDQSTGDFGRGWTLDDTRVGVATTTDLAEGWDANVAGCALFVCYYAVTSEIDKQVYVTWPDGKVDTFTLKVNRFINLFPGMTSMYLESADDNRADAELTDNSAYYINGRLQAGLFGIDGDIEINSIVLKTPGGASYLISKTGGLLRATSPSGETLTYDNNGVTSSVAGAVVRYVRDGQGRITEMIGPNGARTRYTYDANGNLTRVDGPAGESASYTYYADNTLREALDGAGVPVRRIEYDADGRVSAVTDGNGNRVEIDPNVTGRQQIVTDPTGGYTTITNYDDRGNPIRIDEIFDGTTHTTTFEWNAQNLPTRRTDPLGNVWSTAFDANGNPTRFVDPDGNVVTYTYAERGLPATVTDQDGNVTRFTYDDRGLPVSITDALGRAETFRYDAAGRLSSRTDRGGVQLSWTYDATGRIRTATQQGASGPATTTITWDALGNPRTITSPRGGVTEIQYDSAGRILRTTDPLGNSNVVTYDAAGRVLTQTPPDGNTMTFAYDPGGRLTSQIDVLGNTASYTYDAGDRVITMTDPSGAVTTFERDDAGRVVGVTDAVGNTTAYDVDPLGRVTAFTDPLGSTSSFTHDPAGRLLTATTPNGSVWQYRYDARGQLVEVEDPLGQIESRQYDQLGQLTSVTDRRGHETTYAYDAAGQLATMTDALGGTVRFAYDGMGNATSVTDPLGLERTYTYDADGNILTATSPAQGTMTYTYDLAGRPSTVRDARGLTVGIELDEMGRLTGLNTPAGPIDYAYDAIGRRTSMTDLVGTTTWQYDPDHPSLVRRVTSPQGSVSYAYDEIGRRTSMTTAHGTVRYAYDDASQLTALTDWTGASSTFDYDDDGLLQSIVRPNGVSSSFDYDAALRLTGITHQRGTTTIDSFQYTLDANGNRTAVTSSAGTEQYSLDELGRLRSVTYPDGQVATYTYDAAGNRRTETVDGTTTNYTYDSAGRLTSDGSRTFTYDAAGNTTGAGADTYEWDWAGQLASATVDGDEATYAYDGDGVRVSAVDSTGTTEFVWDRESGLPMLVSDGDTGYLTLGRAPFAATAGGGAAFQLTDALGSVRAVTGASGNVLGRQSFDVWGAPRTSLSTTFGFAGEQHDPTGLIHLRARQYDPSIGRLLSADAVQPNAPSTQGWNLYSYAAANPTTLVDPSGNVTLMEYAVTGLIIGAVIGTAIGLFACSGLSGFEQMRCVVSSAAMGGLSGLVGGIVFGLALAALGVSVAAYAVAGGLSGLAGALAGGASSPQELAIAALIGVITAGLGTWIARTPIGRAASQYLDDLFARMRAGTGGTTGGATGGATGGTGGAAGGAAASPSSRVLAANLQAAGTARPAQTAAHHIVAGTDSRAAAARSVLNRFGIDINAADNGVFLPRNTTVPNPTGAAVHSTTHTNSYYDAVNDLLGQATTRNEALQALDYVRQQLLLGGFP